MPTTTTTTTTSQPSAPAPMQTPRRQRIFAKLSTPERVGLSVLGILVLVVLILVIKNWQKKPTEDANHAQTAEQAKAEIKKLVAELGDKGKAGKAKVMLIAKGKDAAPELLEALNDNNKDVRSNSRLILAAMGPQATDSLEKGLSSSSSKIKEASVQLIAEVAKNEQAVRKRLVEIAQDDEAPTAQQSAREALSRMGVDVAGEAAELVIASPDFAKKVKDEVKEQVKIEVDSCKFITRDGLAETLKAYVTQDAYKTDQTAVGQRIGIVETAANDAKIKAEAAQRTADQALAAANMANSNLEAAKKEFDKAFAKAQEIERNQNASAAERENAARRLQTTLDTVEKLVPLAQKAATDAKTAQVYAFDNANTAYRNATSAQQSAVRAEQAPPVVIQQQPIYYRLRRW